MTLSFDDEDNLKNMKTAATLQLILALCLLTLPSLNAQGTQYRLSNSYLAMGPDNDAYMGVYLNSIGPEKARALGFENLYGSYIRKVIAGTPADRAGLRALDYIYGVDAYRTGAEQSLSDILDRYNAGDRAKLYVQRGTDRVRLDIIFGNRNEERRSISVTPCQDPFLGVMKMSKAPQKDGIVIQVVGGSTADEMGLEDGDEILRINGYKILDWTDLTYAINDTEVGSDIEIVAWRGRGRIERSHPIQSRCAYEANKATATVRTTEKQENKYFDTYIKDGNGRRLLSQSMDRNEVQQANRQYGLELKTDQSLPVKNFYFGADFDQKVLEVRFELPGNGPTRVRVFNSKGRAVYDFDLGSFSGTFSDRTNLLKNGSDDYFLEVTQGSKSLVRKVEIRQ